MEKDHKARSWLKSHLSLGVRRAARQLIDELRLQQRHRRGVAKAKTLGGKIKLHLGSGLNSRSGWVNVDLFEPSADLNLDLREPWPFANACVEIIYSEHLFEHFEFPHEAQHVLRESYRVLKPGGLFSVGVPDAPRSFAAYVRGDRDYFSTPPEWNPNYPPWLKVPMHRVNYTLRQMGEHKYAYDEEILTMALREAGFGVIARRDFDPAMDVTGREGTLWIDATKPQFAP